MVEGRRYCESQPITARDGATALLIGATLVAWMIAIAAPMVSLKWWGPYVSAAMFFGPVLVGAAVLYVVGG